MLEVEKVQLHCQSSSRSFLSPSKFTEDLDWRPATVQSDIADGIVVPGDQTRVCKHDRWPWAQRSKPTSFLCHQPQDAPLEQLEVAERQITFLVSHAEEAARLEEELWLETTTGVWREWRKELRGMETAELIVGGLYTWFNRVSWPRPDWRVLCQTGRWRRGWHVL